MLFQKEVLKQGIIENYYWAQGFKRIAGLDEAGRGAIAGPLYVGIVVFPPDYYNPQIKDSKLISPSKRERLFEIICRDALEYGIAFATVEEINLLGLSKAFFLAIERALSHLSLPDLLLIDGAFTLPSYRGIQKALIKGDRLSLSIAAGSILAKVSRDREMIRISQLYPEYGFEKHKGYATKEHFLAIKKYGLTSLHRTNFKCFQTVK